MGSILGGPKPPAPPPPPPAPPVMPLPDDDMAQRAKRRTAAERARSGRGREYTVGLNTIANGDTLGAG